MWLPAEGLAVDLGPQASTGNSLRQNAESVPLMDRYLTRTCPRYTGHVGIIVSELGQKEHASSSRERPLGALCLSLRLDQ